MKRNQRLIQGCWSSYIPFDVLIMRAIMFAFLKLYSASARDGPWKKTSSFKEKF